MTDDQSRGGGRSQKAKSESMVLAGSVKFFYWYVPEKVSSKLFSVLLNLKTACILKSNA